eukprot:g20930.t1
MSSRDLPFQPPARQLVSPFARRWEHLGVFGNAYFLLLDATFLQTVVFTVLAYAFVCLLFLFLTLPLAHEFVSASTGEAAIDIVSNRPDAPADFAARFAVALRLVVTHLVTMGPAEFAAPANLDWLFLLCTLQQFTGIFCNPCEPR